MSIYPNGPPLPDGWPDDIDVRFIKYDLDTWIAAHPERPPMMLDERDSPPSWRLIPYDERRALGPEITLLMAGR